MPAQALTDHLFDFARDIRAGLEREGQKELPCRYFYDEIGSALFDVITLLPEYGLSRADARLLHAHAEEIIQLLPSPLVVAELGSGSGAKTRWILQALSDREPVRYYPIDVSPAALARCAQELEIFGNVYPLEGSYFDGLREVVSRRELGQSLLVLFLGSTIGNLDRQERNEFLAELRGCLLPGDALLLGVDLVKPVARMLLAYDDPAGVTAAFNLNLLARINRELGGNFDLRKFRHEARYSPAERRIEMHLRSLAPQTVTIRDAGITCKLRAGETIWTEACHKFEIDEVEDMAEHAGFQPQARWIDREWPLAEMLLAVRA